MNFRIADKKVWINDVPTQIISGAIHYFRTFPEQWEDRLLKLKNCGFNTVETYLSWHDHETVEGKWDFSGRLDFVKFIELAGQLGLYVIVRPGPYICSECDLGGLPGWLLGKPGLRLRCANPEYLHYVKIFFDRVLPQLVPWQCTKGGPIIAMQIENEYGSYAADKEYLKFVADTIKSNGINVQLFTSDGAGEDYLKKGTLPDYPATINYRNKPEQNFQELDRCDTGYANAHITTELWVGKAWHWGVPPQHHSGKDVAADMREVLKYGSSVNCYMFHGGTNFGFSSGANSFDKVYYPLLTSYEVDSLLNEAGNPTEKYFAVQHEIEKFYPGTTHEVKKCPSCAYPEIHLTEFAALAQNWSALGRSYRLPLPETMEYFGQSTGFILYSTTVNPWDSGSYEFSELQDRAIVMLNGELIGVIYRNDPVRKVDLTVIAPDSRLDILVENMGRVNFGLTMEKEKKGMTGFYKIGGIMQLTDWEIRPLPLDNWRGIKYGAYPTKPVNTPGVYRGKLLIADEPQDTFLKFPEGTRGYVYVNGFNIGRYWTIGPQRTLYIPAPLLKKGQNQIEVLELHGLRSELLQFSAERIIDAGSPMLLQ